MKDAEEDLSAHVAIIGMSGRFPGSADLEEFWSNLRGGVEAVRFFTDEELVAAGESADNLADPSYVRAAATLADIDQFDPAFWGMSPRDAAVFDPQHRLFLECAWQAFEHAGYVGEAIEGSVGVFASCGLSEYMFKNVLANRRMAKSVGEWLIRHTGNDTNFLATRVSYELGLRGPSMNVQTACSSTLVAVHLACQSLLSGECDVALAGGAVVAPTQDRGYFYKEGEILAPDGHCRAFDASAAGTILSSACGAVLLKPLTAALEDGDNVLAVVRGSAVNNDGRAKVGYLAPSVSGQSRVVAEALAVAGVDAADVSYIEAHGTGTLLGDPIEIAGLTQAFRRSTDRTQFCAIGSLKSNIGHAGEAAGIAALIKTVLALQHREIPPSLHYRTPNPQIDFAHSPFFVNAHLRPWKAPDGGTRIAGITGLGAGGTNVHVLVEEFLSESRLEPSTRPQLVTVSGRTPAAADRAATELARFLEDNPDTNLADVAYTRLTGRKRFAVRHAVVATSAKDAAAQLELLDGRPAAANRQASEIPAVVFMIPGGGAQYPGMGAELYETEPVYRDTVDRCSALLRPVLGFDLRDALFPSGDYAAATRRLERPSVSLPALFTTEYAMAMLLQSWGVSPSAMIGHSAGEYVVACLSGVITLQDGLALIAERGRLFETLPPGAMLVVPLSEDEARAQLLPGLSIAAVNTPSMCVVSGPVSLIEEMEAALSRNDVEGQRVHIDVAAHSSMLEPILESFGRFCRTIRFSSPKVPYISNLTGTWITESETTDPNYWVRHLRHSVRFAEGIDRLLEVPNTVLVEVGPGRTLSSFARAASRHAAAQTTTMRHPQEVLSDLGVALDALGRLWVAGVDVDATSLFGGQPHRRIPLPTYPFERQRYWVDPDVDQPTPSSFTGELTKRSDVADWFYSPSWRRSFAAGVTGSSASTEPSSTLMITNGGPFADQLAASLRSTGETLITVTFGERFERRSSRQYIVNPSQSADFTELVSELTNDGLVPRCVVHMTAVGPSRGRRFGRQPDALRAFEATAEQDYSSVAFLAQALSSGSQPMRLFVVTSGVYSLGAQDELHPERALLHGACRVIPRELGHVTTAALDIDTPARGSAAARVLVERLCAEFAVAPTDNVIAYRHGERWTRSFDPIRLPATTASPWKSHGVYLITGGLGGIGLSIAEQIAASVTQPTLVLVGRSQMPPESTWQTHLASDATDATLRQRIEAVRRIRAHGAAVIINCTDVTDLESMTSLVAGVQAAAGRITGVIHTAGLLRDALIALRTPLAGSQVIDVKARSVLILDQLLAKHPPELVILCSSVSSIIGLPGQIDYTAANAFLDSFATAKRSDESTRTIVVNWSAWQQVGMAVAAEQLATERSESAPAMQASTPVATAADAALFDEVRQDGATATFSANISRERDWLVAEHVVRGGEALIPGTGFLELLREAGVPPSGRAGPTELRDVFFLAPFAVGVDESRLLQLTIDHSTGSAVAFSESPSTPLVTATVTPAQDSGEAVIDLVAIRARCAERTEHFDGYSDQPFMQFGPRWGSLRRVDYGDQEALVTTSMPEAFAGELADMWLHPAVLDVATGSAQALIASFDPLESFFVPLSYGRVLVRGPVPQTAYSHVRLRPTNVADIAVFDISICDEEAREVISIEAFTMRRIAAGPGLTSGPRPAAERSADPRIESPISAALRAGILPSEGVDALDRLIVANFSPQVVVSSIDLQTWTDKVDSEATADSSEGGEAGESAGAELYERPEISSAFVAPATPIERELASMWRELLGLDQVGRNDDFFDLGGQSLVALRLFSRMKKRYALDLPLATLFEAPTIAQCAAIVASKLGIADTADTADTAGEDVEVGSVEQSPPPVDPGTVVVTSQPAPFSSLVTIQQGTADRIPFFCAHGSGGNVLNFRDLSVAMGRNQPFYGLQARGIDGRHRPQDSIEEMAAAYLHDIRTVRPNGPYIFGGYSGGGLIAYEMARQASAAGDDVRLVVLLDTFPPVIPNTITFAARLHRLRTEHVLYLRHIVLRRIDARRYLRRTARLDAILANGGVIPVEMREKYVEQHFLAASIKYERTPYHGRVVLLRADEVHLLVFQGLGESYGWSDVAQGEFEVIRSPGNHDTILLEPNATVLVRLLRDILDSAASTAPSPG